jgi:hypothetical protein
MGSIRPLVVQASPKGKDLLELPLKLFLPVVHLHRVFAGSGFTTNL